MSKLWTPAGMVAPDTRKDEGGTYFDDELETKAAEYTKQQRESLEMRRQLNTRPDHTIFVASVEARAEMRKVLNFWFQKGELQHHPTIEIDYGIPDGEMRIGDR